MSRQEGEQSLAAVTVAVALVAGTLLAWEVALTRILAIRQWSHFAYLVISVALLGFGASGTFLAVLGNWGARRRPALLRLATLLFVPSLPLSQWLIRFIPFELNHLLMQPIGEPWRLLLLPFRSGWVVVLELVLAVPFFIGATVIALGLLEAGRGVGRVYGANMLGSGAGSAVVVGLLYLFRPGWIAAALTPVAVVAAGVLTLRAGRRWRACWGIGTVVGLVAGLLSAAPVEPSEYKGLSAARLLPGANVEAERWSPFGLLTLVSGPSIRHSEGMSLTYSTSESGELPPQMALFFDADDPSPVLGVPTPPQSLAYLDYLPSAVAYHLLEAPSALIIGMGGGSEVVAAVVGGARSVTAVEIDPLVLRVLAEECEEFTGHLLRRPEVRAVVGDARGYLEGTPEHFDLIQVPPLGGFGSSVAGMFALSPAYLFTVEGMERAIERLSPGGIMAVTRWDNYPERDGIRMLATVLEAAERLGLDPRPRLTLYRGYSTATILFSRRPWTEEQLATSRKFCLERGFDLCYYPGITPVEVNRFTQLDQPEYYLAAKALLFGDRDDFYRGRLFRTRPTSDQQPYFFSYLRWRAVPWLVRSLGTEWIPTVGRGYVFLVLALVETTALGVVLIVVPLLFLRRVRRAPGKLAVGVYFFCLGLAYMLLEITCIQRFLLCLPTPVHSLAVVLATFLVGSGLGSLAADHFPGGPRWAVRVAAVGIAAMVVLHVTVLPAALRFSLGSSLSVRTAVAVVTLAPLAFLMGLPFPSGFRLLRSQGEGLAPWAWGVNGCASVVGASAATLLAIELGLHATMLGAVACYLVALAVVARLPGQA